MLPSLLRRRIEQNCNCSLRLAGLAGLASVAKGLLTSLAIEV
jgi:hypothetical protein